jgi:pantetheine-phosphate adenylyltransferase
VNNENEKKEKICVVPGTFDPVTNGHLDVIERAVTLFDKVYVTSFDNTEKRNNMFNSDERLEMLRLACLGLDKVIVDATSELTADYAKSKNAGFLIKGVRGMIDYEYEYNLFLINREIGGNIETIFFPALNEHMFISSTFVREMIKYKRDISTYVPPRVAEFIKDRIKQKEME